MATDCHYEKNNETKEKESEDENEYEEVGAPDTECQDQISMKFAEVRQSVIQGEFMVSRPLCLCSTSLNIGFVYLSWCLVFIWNKICTSY